MGGAPLREVLSVNKLGVFVYKTGENNMKWYTKGMASYLRENDCVAEHTSITTEGSVWCKHTTEGAYPPLRSAGQVLKLFESVDGWTYWRMVQL